MVIESKRADKKKNIDRVTACLINNPFHSESKIAKELWISSSTAHLAKKEIEQSKVKDDRIVSLTDLDFDCINLWVKEIKRRLEDKDELKSMRVTEISQVIKENTARYTLFRWDATDSRGWLKNTVKFMTDDELLNIVD